MPVTVTVERHIAPGTQQQVKALLGQLWQMAKTHPGHISGRTLVDAFNPGIILTISEWTDLAARERWEKDPECVRVVKTINALLAKTTPIRVWVQDDDAPPPAV
ncbi:MAG: hypothetical protein FJ312_07120 [SAR202 cluster bacterium]|nr:hypothetical protein [SAR202 cluster bacterium]